MHGWNQPTDEFKLVQLRPSAFVREVFITLSNVICSPCTLKCANALHLCSILLFVYFVFFGGMDIVKDFNVLKCVHDNQIILIQCLRYILPYYMVREGVSVYMRNSDTGYTYLNNIAFTEHPLLCISNAHTKSPTSDV